MLRHVLPTGDDAAILDRALAALLTELARQKFGTTERQRRGRQTSPASRHIPAAVRSGSGISARAPSRAQTAGAAARARSSSSITCGHSRRAASRPCPTSSFAAANTTGTKRRCSSPRRPRSGTRRLLPSEARSRAFR